MPSLMDTSQASPNWRGWYPLLVGNPGLDVTDNTATYLKISATCTWKFQCPRVPIDGICSILNTLFGG